MKKLILFSVFFLSASQALPDWFITRGPVPGEIYFMGGTHTGYGLYHSTDFGETAVCVDSTTQLIMTITADKTPGVIYYTNLVEALYISYDYGNQGSWQYRNSGINLQINSGVIEGTIYNAFVSHSSDYGNNFMPHSYNGFFGNTIDVEIDNEADIGYVLVNKFGVSDSLFLLKSTDNFENLELQHSFHTESNYGSLRRLSRCFYQGELFFFKGSEGRLLISQNFGEEWYETNYFNKSLAIAVNDIVGGRTEGEIYSLYLFSSMSGINTHIYILRSIDYGITYEVLHPFAKGQEPLLSQFSAKSVDNDIIIIDIKTIDSVYFVTGEMPLDVQFYNYSIGDINLYEWDFNNDGIVDSNEENPIHTYTDTGWYSVDLSVYDDYDTNSFLRENYIHVVKTTGITDIFQPVLNNYPNPLDNTTTINYYVPYRCKISFEILDILGKEVMNINQGSKQKGEQKITIDLSNFAPGVYYYVLKADNSVAGVRKMVVK
ncbi:MAG: T9SS type A sorting domain-containing protein [Bacteroidetes bacterium]|nr:T9SS type A sorting domain-containing protein [Bacteroidota bacterium]MBL7104615.1 T9SS type A sorting domain-containing protein [Bacteroidales bacterium]